ncbi:MAG TPA: twin-arginine translocation signal domain-containing protein [Candidatus Saccharimonadales bacterium]|nr:twin-arginine translocation signal domain-containing protein [Candidatus Saccharimonadales bacterium]
MPENGVQSFEIQSTNLSRRDASLKTMYAFLGLIIGAGAGHIYGMSTMYSRPLDNKTSRRQFLSMCSKIGAGAGLLGGFSIPVQNIEK